jgi:hypothetical protein
MASVKEQRPKAVHLKSAGLALSVAILQAVFAGLVTPMTKFSAADCAFAFVLTYGIAMSIFSHGGQI